MSSPVVSALPTGLPTSGFPELTLNYNNTYGVLVIGLLICAVLFGVTNVQVFFYHTTYSDDWIGTKISVYYLWLMDMFHLAITAHYVYYVLISHFGDPIGLEYIPWSFRLQAVITATGIFSVQALYISRIILLNGGQWKWVPWAGAAMVMLSLGSLIFQSYTMYSVKDMTDYDSETIKWTVYFCLSCVTFIDLIIVVLLSLILGRSRTGWLKSNTVVDTLIIYVFSTGLTTSIYSLTTIITYATTPMTFTYIAMEFCLMNLYINSYIAMVNARRHLRNKRVATLQHRGSGESSGQDILHIGRESKSDREMFPAFMGSTGSTFSIPGHPMPPLPERARAKSPNFMDLGRPLEVRMEREIYRAV